MPQQHHDPKQPMNSMSNATHGLEMNEQHHRESKQTQSRISMRRQPSRDDHQSPLSAPDWVNRASDLFDSNQSHDIWSYLMNVASFVALGASLMSPSVSLAENGNRVRVEKASEGASEVSEKKQESPKKNEKNETAESSDSKKSSPIDLSETQDPSATSKQKSLVEKSKEDIEFKRAVLNQRLRKKQEKQIQKIEDQKLISHLVERMHQLETKVGQLESLLLNVPGSRISEQLLDEATKNQNQAVDASLSGQDLKVNQINDREKKEIEKRMKLRSKIHRRQPEAQDHSHDSMRPYQSELAPVVEGAPWPEGAFR